MGNDGRGDCWRSRDSYMPKVRKAMARSASSDSEEEKFSRGGMQNLFAKKQAQMSKPESQLKSKEKMKVSAHNDIVQAFDANGNFTQS